MIKLVYNSGFKWYYDDNLFVKGYVYDNENKCISGYELLTYFRRVISDTPFENLKNVNGVFSLIYKNETTIWIASDKTRYFPVFYSINQHKLLISDNPDVIIIEKNLKNILDISASEFTAAGYITGNNTLIEGIYQVQAGEFIQLAIDGKILDSIFFSLYSVNYLFKEEYVALKSKFNHVLESAFSRLADSLKGYTPVVPLSGGYDSRLIAVMLKKFGFDNTICFTYGRNDHREKNTSKEVAKELGFTWYYIEYSQENIHGFYFDPYFKSYYKYAARYTSMFYMQEYFAVKYLKENNLIPDNAVFLPGHSGDLLGGSQFFKVIPKKLKYQNLPKFILAKKFDFSLDKTRAKSILFSKLQSQFNGSNFSDCLPFSSFEEWDIREKIAKFIFNSSQVFTFFGYEVRFPYWDKEIFAFCKHVPPEFKRHKQLYDEVLIEDYFKSFNVHFVKEFQPKAIDILLNRLKNKIKPYLPNKMKWKYLIKNDLHNYYQITQELYKTSGEVYPARTNSHRLNYLIMNWYVKQVSIGIKKN